MFFWAFFSPRNRREIRTFLGRLRFFRPFAHVVDMENAKKQMVLIQKTPRNSITKTERLPAMVKGRYFQHAHFIPTVGVGKRDVY